MILSFVFFMGCQLVEKDNDVVNKGLEKGLYKSDFEDESPFLRVAYQSDNNEFNIDNVTLTFYYGASYSSGIQLELENGLNIPVFELYFQNDEGTTILIKHIEENLVSEKYSCDFVFDDNYQTQKIIYHYSEKLTIPQELFSKESGVILFYVYGENVNSINEGAQILGYTKIYYKKDAITVLLSNENFN